ncbi:MAG: HI0074 family nucleotidyltransferase substrate-binding subunit [Lachnospiraceae bacterium]|nr:HI0074 family nucleotidyltransferase substrate-binding subunit [Lachnospiraceae bacterium]
MPKSYTNRFNSFKKSLDNLLKAKNEDKSNILVLSGTIMIFNLTFDLAWKVIREVLKEEFGIIDFPSGSPKETLKRAASVDLIQSEIWLDMLNDRNDLTHIYDSDLANEKFDKIIDSYIPIFEIFVNKISGYIEGDK